MTNWLTWLRAPGERDNPFVPGQGHVPPFLAGRESEQELLQLLVDRLAKKVAPESSVFLYGPRGNGKTALLRWAQRRARSNGIRTIWLSGRSRLAEEVLLRKLSLLPSWLNRLSGASLLGSGVQVRDAGRGIVSEQLERRVRRTPLLLAWDEAHQMDVRLGHEILNSAQALQGEGRPLMLVLAGTPDLPRHLSAMDASIWSRGRQLPIGRLQPAASADAIRIPLEEHGRSIEENALEQVVRESHGYPYFLQVWGELLWPATPAGPVSIADVDRARPSFASLRDSYYDERYEELQRVGLVKVARRVATLFSGSEVRRTGDMEKAVSATLRDGGSKAARAACDQLRHLGFIWRVINDGVQYYEPGIPSLMAFVIRNTTLEAEDESS